MVSSQTTVGHIAVYNHPISTSVSEVLDRLISSGYQINHIDSREDLRKQSISPDIIFITPQFGLDDKSTSHFSDTNATAPIVILLTERYTDDWPVECADFVFPPEPEFVLRQLRTLLSWRNKHKKLIKEGDVLRASLDKHQRLNDEVEVLKNAIVRNVSHELKTPLLQVKSAVALLAEDVDNEELISYAKGATTRLEALVKHITLLGGSLEIHLAPIIIRDTIEYARRNLGRIWEHREAIDRVRVELEPSLPPALADKQGISTVIQLLLDNALKFSKREVEVKATTTDDNRIRISIRDYGIGIAEDHLDAIFDTFYQIDHSSTRRYGGAGVGLAIVRLILEHHNSKITVSSQLGRGSTFSFLLKIAEL